MYLHLIQTRGDIFALTPALSPRKGVGPGRAGARPYRVQSYRVDRRNCEAAPSPRPSPPGRESDPDAQERVPTESKVIVWTGAIAKPPPHPQPSPPMGARETNGAT